MGDDRRRGQEEAEAVPADLGVLHAGLTETLLDDALQLRVGAEPAVALGEVHPREAHVVLGAAERQPVGGVVLREELIGESEDLLGVHGRRLRRAGRARTERAPRRTSASVAVRTPSGP